MKIKKSQLVEIGNELKTTIKSFKLLGFGAHNVNYLLITDKGKFVLRIENNCQFDNIKKEYEFLKETDGKFGPKVFLFDESKEIIPHRYLIEEFLEGEPPKKVNDHFLIKMGEYYKSLHKNTKNKTKDISPLEMFKNYAEPLYKKYSRLLGEHQRTDLKKLYLNTIKKLKGKETKFLDLKKLSLNHGDPARENIFYNNEGHVIMIDWEFVGYKTIEEDLTFFVWMHDLNEKQKQLFLKSYEYPENKERFNLIMVEEIWGMIGWRLERLNLLVNRKLDAHQRSESEDEISEAIQRDITKLKHYLPLI